MTITVLQPTDVTGIDTMIKEGLPTRNYGAVFTISAGKEGSTQAKGLIKFDLSSIPTGSIIVSASLTLLSYYEYSSTDYSVALHRSLVEWFPGVQMGGLPPQGSEDGSTWNLRNHIPGTTWVGGAGGVAGSDYASVATDTKLITSVGGSTTYSWDVASDVQDFVDGTYDNHGWWLIGSSSNDSAKMFYSSNNGTASVRPKLTIEYEIDFEALPDSGSAEASSALGGLAVGPQVATALSGSTIGTTLASINVIPSPASAIAGVDVEVLDVIIILNRIADFIGSTELGYAIKGSVTRWPSSAIGDVSAAIGTSIIDNPAYPTAAIAIASATVRPYAYRIEPKEVCTSPILYLTDGTVKENGQLNRLDLLSEKIGVRLRNWNPSISQYKQGGYFSESALGSGRRLVRRAFSNAVEVMELEILGHSQDGTIKFLRELLDFQEQAADFWTSEWSSRPVYLAARSAGETKTRFALVHVMSISELNNPYSQPFFNSGNSVLESITLRIERDHWVCSMPGGCPTLPISNSQVEDVNSWGNFTDLIDGNVLTMVETADGNIIAGTDSYAKIYGTTSPGGAWQLLATLSATATDSANQIILGHGSNLIAAVSGDESGLWKSSDNGLSWSKWVEPPPSSNSFTEDLVQLQPDASSGLDLYISQQSPANNHGVVTFFQVGKSSNLDAKGLLRFDLASIPSNATIISASISLKTTLQGNTNAVNIGIHRSLVQWFEGNQMGGLPPSTGVNGSTWNYRNHNGSIAWAGGAGGAAGTEYAATATSTTSVSGAVGQRFNFDVTADVQNFVNGSQVNFGWWLVSSGGANDFKSFLSSDSYFPEDRPRITINYQIELSAVSGFYSVAYSSFLQEYVASGGVVNGPGLVSRTIYSGGAPNYDTWYHLEYPDVGILRAVKTPRIDQLGVQDQSSISASESFLLASSQGLKSPMVRSSTASHNPPAMLSDFSLIFPVLPTGATCLAANNNPGEPIVLIGCENGSIWKAVEGSNPLSPWSSISRISSLPASIDALHFPLREGFSDENLTVYASCDSTVYGSKDGGYTWTAISGAFASPIYSLLKYEDSLYAGSVDEVYRNLFLGAYSWGQSETFDQIVHVSNFRGIGNITNVKKYNSAITEYFDLQFSQNPPYQLFPVVPEVGDITYFGNSVGGFFNSLVFEIQIGSSGLTGLVWEYWDGSAWSSLSVQDNTNSFTTPGTFSVVWEIPSDWESNTVDSQEANWVRVRVTSVGSSRNTPVIGNKPIYSSSLPFVEVAGDRVGGDIPAIARILWKNVGSGSSISHDVDRMVVGLRSQDRGNDFSAFLPAKSSSVVPGINISKDIDGTWTLDSTFPTAEYLSVEHSSSGRLNIWNKLVLFDLSTSIGKTYFGTYRAFARIHQPSGSTSVWKFRTSVGFGSGGKNSYSRIAKVYTNDNYEIIDMGQITVPATSMIQFRQNIGDILQISLEGYCTTASVAVKIYDLILIPTDEWACDAITPDPEAGSPSSLEEGYSLDLDSENNPKASLICWGRNSSDLITSMYRTVSNGPAIVQAGKTQRLWFLPMAYENHWQSKPGITGVVKITRQQRFLSLRGER